MKNWAPLFPHRLFVVKPKSSRNSWTINFNKCPEYCFQNLEKGKLGHLLKTCVNPSHKHMHINPEREKHKNQETAKANKPEQPQRAKKPRATRATHHKDHNNYKNYKSRKNTKTAKAIAAHFMSHKKQKPLKPRDQIRKTTQTKKSGWKTKRKIPLYICSLSNSIISFHSYGLVLPALIYDLF